VQQLILATADHHHVEGDPDSDLLVDADLSILGSSLQKYVEYAHAVRREYAHLDDKEYTKGRSVHVSVPASVPPYAP
jgi:predicted metal-dependent HD superfamily phosphohydrolase